MDDIPLLPSPDQLSQPMQALRDDRHRKFAWAYMMGAANGAEAARWAGFSDSSGAAKVTAHHLLLRDDIQAALRDLGQRYLFNLMPKALMRLNALLDSPNKLDQGKAIERVLNRVKGFAEQQKVDVEVTGEVKIGVTDAALQDLRSLLALGVSREKLIETFGHSELPRLERMLLAAQQRSEGGEAKTIEHD